jgi:hypothetical protein
LCAFFWVFLLVSFGLFLASKQQEAIVTDSLEGVANSLRKATNLAKDKRQEKSKKLISSCDQIAAQLSKFAAASKKGRLVKRLFFLNQTNQKENNPKNKHNPKTKTTNKHKKKNKHTRTQTNTAVRNYWRVLEPSPPL